LSFYSGHTGQKIIGCPAEMSDTSYNRQVLLKSLKFSWAMWRPIVKVLKTQHVLHYPGKYAEVGLGLVFEIKIK